MDIVQKSFTAAGVELYSGEVVNADSFPNQDVLRRHGYIKPFTGKAHRCKICKRVFTTEYVLNAHILADHEVPEEVQTEGDLDLITDTTEPEGSATSPAVPEGSEVPQQEQAPTE